MFTKAQGATVIIVIAAMTHHSHFIKTTERIKSKVGVKCFTVTTNILDSTRKGRGELIELKTFSELIAKVTFPTS